MKNDMQLLKIKEERVLIKKALAGDNLAWTQIIFRVRNVIRNAVKSHLKKFNNTFSSDDANDVYQEVVLKLHKSAFQYFLDNNDVQKEMSGFVYVVALNTAKDYTKSKLGKSRLVEINPDVGDDDDEGVELLQTVAVDDQSSEEQAILNEERKILMDEIGALDEDKKNILKMYVEGFCNKNIAEKIKKSENYVSKCVFSFKQYMQKKYKGV